MNAFNHDFLDSAYLHETEYVPGGTSNNAQMSPNRNAVAQAPGDLPRNDVATLNSNESATVALLKQMGQLMLSINAELLALKREVIKMNEGIQKNHEEIRQLREDIQKLQEQPKKHMPEPLSRSRPYRNEPYQQNARPRMSFGHQYGPYGPIPPTQGQPWTEEWY